jgi:hypothetical protein
VLVQYTNHLDHRGMHRSRDLCFISVPQLAKRVIVRVSMFGLTYPISGQRRNAPSRVDFDSQAQRSTLQFMLTQ